MNIAETLLPEFDQEMAGTRKVLERIPNDKLTWKAHPKSNTIGWVGTHLAEMPGWAPLALQRDSLDIRPVDGPAYQTPQTSSREEILAIFDKNVAAARAAIHDTSDAEFAKPWSLLSAGKVMFTLPRVAVIRSFVMNHVIHHRAYLCSYLRLNDVAVPSLYGPSGDE